MLILFLSFLLFCEYLKNSDFRMLPFQGCFFLLECSYLDVVQSLSRVWFLVTPCTAARQTSLSFTISGSLLKLKSIESDAIKPQWCDYSTTDRHLECKVKCTLGSINTNKASGGDGIPAELFQVLKDDAVKVLHSVCWQIWKLNGGHRTGKGQFSFQSQRRAMPKNVQNTTQLHSFPMLAK